jgi:nitroreductase
MIEPAKINGNVTAGPMTAVMETIYKRRSVRAYSPQSLPRNLIKAVIDAGNQAPSRGRDVDGEFHFQPWRFVVAEDPELKKKLIQTTSPIWKKSVEGMKESHPDTYKKAMSGYELMSEPRDPVFYSAPVILFVIGPATHAISCALACENIMLAATSLGLGSCYVGFGAMITHNNELIQVLGLNNEERIFGPILLGYAKDSDDLHSTRTQKKDALIKWT